MDDRILERRMRIETELKSPKYQEWLRYCDEVRKGCSFFSPNEPYISSNICESCNNYEVCSHIEKEQSRIPLIPTIA